MSRKRGLSLDDKRNRMVELFYEKKTFFQLKELEKIAPKEKGITSMSVKEVVQSLVDDGLVDSDKIGTSIYFWAFPSKALQNRKNRLESVKDEIKSLEEEMEKNENSILKSSVGKEDSDQRNEIQEKYSGVKIKLDEIYEELAKYEDCDIGHINNLKTKTTDLISACNRWTDNIFSAIKFCKEKMSLEEKEIYKYFNIPEEFDYLE